MSKRGTIAALLVVLATLCFSCGGQEYFASPEKLLAYYMQHKAAGNAADVDAMINCFTKADKEWWDRNYRAICDRLYGQECPPGDVQAEATVWTDKFEPRGPSSETADSIRVNENEGTAVLTVGGKEYELVREEHDWKFNGFFGADAELIEQLKINN